MGFTCPWCDFVSQKYPRSAGIKHVMEHMEDEHPNKLEQYQKLKTQWEKEWNEKIENSDSLLEKIRLHIKKINDEKPRHKDVE